MTLDNLRICRNSTTILVMAALALCAACGGCSRTWYRKNADKEVYSLVQEKAGDPRWANPNYTINVDPRSRFYDPFCPDKEPMPPDDPAAHKLMHCVDGKKGSPKWHCNGDTPGVANPQWMDSLPWDENGFLKLNLEAAIEIGRVNSREYQRSREELYLSALDVAFERFRFDAQFYGRNSTFFTADGPARAGGNGDSSSVLNTDTSVGFNKLYATGGELAVNLANSLVWQFAGPDDHTPTTILDFNLVQPLLRGAGRERVLERLTLSERTLLGNVRLMERYRQGFYATLVTGRDSVQGPARRGGVFGSGLEGFTGVGSGFGRVVTTGANNNTGVAGGAGAAQAGGFMGLLQQQLQIRNQQANVAALRDSLAQLEAAHKAARIDRFQVDLARQALYNAESRLLTARAQYAASVDTYKVTLGLPPKLETRIDDSTLRPFELIDRAFPPIQNDLTRLQVVLGEMVVDLRADIERDGFLARQEFQNKLTRLAKGVDQVLAAYDRTEAHYPSIEQDFARLSENIERRERGARRFQRMLRQRQEDQEIELGTPENENASLSEEIQEIRALPQRLRENFNTVTTALAKTPESWEVLRGELQWLVTDGAAATPNDFRLRMGKLSGRPADPRLAERDLPEAYIREILGWLPDRLTLLAGQVLELSLIQAEAKSEAVTLPVIEMTAEEAVDIARENRLDWMNARADLVNSWRLIDFNANDLMAGLNVVFSGDISNVGDRAFDLRSKTGRLRVGLEFDTPIARLAERNNYRQALIDYQQARRDYLLFEDRISQSLRNTLRTIQLNSVNFELRRAAVRVALAQVEQSRLRLNEPPKPGVASTFGATTARDLVTALSDLLSVQNDFLSVWVNNEVQRIELDLGMGTMQVDHRGLWIDPYQRKLQAEPVPTPPPVKEELPPLPVAVRAKIIPSPAARGETVVVQSRTPRPVVEEVRPASYEVPIKSAPALEAPRQEPRRLAVPEAEWKVVVPK